jgi:hypothetical protein
LPKKPGDKEEEAMSYKFTGKFKVGDEVFCIKQDEPLVNMQVGDRGTIKKVDLKFKRYETEIIGRQPPYNNCDMREAEIETEAGREAAFLANRRKLIKQIARGRHAE